jgi:hypothetical protein
VIEDIRPEWLISAWALTLAIAALLATWLEDRL